MEEIGGHKKKFFNEVRFRAEFPIYLDSTKLPHSSLDIWSRRVAVGAQVFELATFADLPTSAKLKDTQMVEVLFLNTLQ